MSEVYFGIVVKINAERTEFVINKGSSHGVYDGLKFQIIEFGEEIIDPETNESLGTLEILKGTAKVLHIQEKMTTLISNEYRVIPAQEEIRFENDLERKKSPYSNYILEIFKTNDSFYNRHSSLKVKNNSSTKVITESQKEIKPLPRVKLNDKVKLIP
ncbi:hypothetical protein [Rahnella sp. WP5]|uniref:hypothetical protein n=1 Tax=Rahnella sp. WP5 TaxID=1500266 RepID=UPI00068EF213|nr:hypothetical protein [Rahnella sp. WP5]